VAALDLQEITVQVEALREKVHALRRFL